MFAANQRIQRLEIVQDDGCDVGYFVAASSALWWFKEKWVGSLRTANHLKHSSGGK
jgi:hypothetical protein